MRYCLFTASLEQPLQCFFGRQQIYLSNNAVLFIQDYPWTVPFFLCNFYLWPAAFLLRGHYYLLFIRHFLSPCYTQSPFSSLSLSRIIYNCRRSSHLRDLSSETLPTVKSLSCLVMNCSPRITITVLICPALRVNALAVRLAFFCRVFRPVAQYSAVNGGITVLFVGTK